MEWMDRSESYESKADIQNDDKVKIYNSILKEQVKILKESIRTAFSNPRYMAIQPYLTQNFSPTFLMTMSIEETKDLVKMYQNIVKDLCGQEAEKYLRFILKKFALN
jgi:hypothetical protein